MNYFTMFLAKDKISRLILSSILAILAMNMTCKSIEATRPATNVPAHHRTSGFRNPHDDSDRGLLAFLKWQLHRGPYEPPALPAVDIPNYRPEFAPPDHERIQTPDPDQIQITWIGHATFLVQVAGVNLLTDPIFSQRCSPVSFSGPERVARPGLTFDELPEIHAVVISHNHYDHLDAPTIERLGSRPQYFVPLGLTAWFRTHGIARVFEADWWQSCRFRGLRFHAVPAQHFSGRSPFDRDKTLWCGWVIESPLGNIYFAGDTGYSPAFREIGERFGSMVVAMIPIGAYKPRWFMSPVHVDPPQAVRIHQDVRSQNSLAMHWGTFNLTDERLAEPPVYLAKALDDAGIGAEQFRVLRFGEMVLVR